jgi:glycosyltransferase involved in cell wall biosynthesis
MDVDELDSAGTDGVSLEIAKRKEILQEMGHKVAICSAYDWADFPVPGLEFERDAIVGMVRNLFGSGITDFADEGELEEAFNSSRFELNKSVEGVVNAFVPNVVFVHNMLCLPVHPAATVGFTDLLQKRRFPCVAIHHDVLSEGAYKFTPTCPFASDVLEKYFPPQMPNLSHWTINTRNKRALQSRGVVAQIIHDAMDFDSKLDPGERTRIRTRLRRRYRLKDGDIVLLVAARIVPNKQTELAGRLASVIRELRQEMTGKKLYNGNKFTDANRIVLIVAGRPERTFVDYQKSLFELFDTLRLDWIYAGDCVRSYRDEDNGIYSLYPDLYTLADFVLYPTGWEGFGNQLLEAFAAGLPVAVFEYPVFKEDIASKGFKVVSLGDALLSQRDASGLARVSNRVLKRAASEIMSILTTPESYQGIAEQNVILGRQYFSFNVLRVHLQSALNWACNFSS